MEFQIYVLGYRVEVAYIKEEGFFAKVPSLPGCITSADTMAELIEMIEDAMCLWIQVALEDGYSFHPTP